MQHEYAAAGTATSYKAVGALTHDGRWKFVPAATAPYRTRVLVARAGEAPTAFSGTVVVEWLNVSGGVDADPEWTSLAGGDRPRRRRLGRRVGPAHRRGGRTRAGEGATASRAPRPRARVSRRSTRRATARSSIPGDGYSFDIFTQVARALRTGAGLGGLQPQRLIAAGESQSAFALVTYFNGVQPLTHAFDGFFVHSRGAVGLPLVAPGKYADIAGAISGTPTIFRTDQDAPVLDIQTETDVASILDSYAARQPDSDRFRLWEVAGTAHADAHLVGPSAKYIDCGVPINNGPMHIVAKAALRALTTWLTTGTGARSSRRASTSTPGATPQIRRDADGIALGGIRTPPVDVPVATLSGAPGPNPSTICLLLGSTKPFSAARLAQLYPSRADVPAALRRRRRRDDQGRLRAPRKTAPPCSPSPNRRASPADPHDGSCRAESSVAGFELVGHPCCKACSPRYGYSVPVRESPRDRHDRLGTAGDP